MLRKVRQVCNYLLLKARGVQIEAPNISIEGRLIKKTKASRIKIGRAFVMRSEAILNVSDRGALDIKDRVFINHGTIINVRDHVSIGVNVMIGQNVLIYDHDHNYRVDDWRTHFVSAPVTIGDNAWIGSGVIILKGVTIGPGAVIAAGSIIVDDVPGNVVYRRKLGEPIIKPRDSGNSSVLSVDRACEGTGIREQE